MCRAVLQRVNISSQTIRVIGFLLSITGYALLTDWQAISYDPCTEYSPFHHPKLFQTQGKLSNESNDSNSSTKLNNTSSDFILNIFSSVDLEFSDGKKLEFMMPLGVHYVCKEDTFCSENDRPTFSFQYNHFGHSGHSSTSVLDTKNETFSCFQANDTGNKQTFCVNLLQDKNNKMTSAVALASADIQSLLVLPNDIYAKASNSCMNALDGQCHWIPFSTITHKKCVDCPPICRGKHQTLSLAQLVLGLAILIFTSPFEWVPLIAMTSNQVPHNKKFLV